MMMNLFSPVDIGPAKFGAFSPALQTEALRLMAEAGLTVPRMRDATGLDCADILSIGRRRHRVALDAREHQGSPRGKQPLGLSDSARLILLMMLNQAGGLAASVYSIGYDIGKSTSSVRDALKVLQGRALIELTAPSRGKNFPAEYRMTKAGEALAAEIGSLPAKDDADA